MPSCWPARRSGLAAAALACALGAAPAAGEGLDAAARIAADRQAGRPLVAHVFVALCDNRNQGIVPVPARLGNGQDPAGNLYWGARFGLRTYFTKAAGWKRLPYDGPRPPGVLERVLFERGSGAARTLVVADAWDGARMRETVVAFLEVAAGRAVERVTAGGQTLEAGGAAHVVAFVGHNGLMDFAAPSLAEGQRAPARAAIVLACASRPYFQELLGRARAEPLLLTTGLMAPEAYSLEAALRAWFEGKGLPAARRAAAEAYDAHQGCGRRAALRLFDGAAR